jgi:uncharacterized protein (TIGR03083 family)
MTDLVSHIRRDAAALADAAETDPEAAIRRYPDWSELDLLVHTGSVHRRTMEVVRTRSLVRMGRFFPPDEEWTTVLPWFREGAALMTDVLEHTDPRTPVWAFGPNPCVGSWRLRMALETAVHRWDAQRGVGVPDPIDPVLAARGIEEFGILWGEAIPIGGLAGDLGIRAIDTGHTSVLSVVTGHVRLAPGDADVAVTGPVSDLYLWLLGRVSSGELAMTGEVDPWERAIRSLPDASR